MSTTTDGGGSMQHDRPITISVGANRRDTNWKQQKLTISELYDRLKLPTRGTETMAEYFALKKSQQDDLKDVGGYVAGPLNGKRRKASAMTGRDVITLDFDNIPGWGSDDIISRLDDLGCGYCVYSTRKHTNATPRLRVLVPLDRTVTPDEYEPCARRVAAHIGIEKADPTTFEVSRLMYWPSCCSDSEYLFKTKDAPLISADFLLGTYANWRDFAFWPQVPNAVSYQKLAVKQGDPETKPGVVGAFCRTYDVYKAIDELIPGIYSAADGTSDRYTYLNGSTTGGAVVYDHGKFLYSHHATDPCSGRLVNSFDLVRLHRFGDKDDSVAPDTPTTRLPSYLEMCKVAVADKAVAALLARERHDSAINDFLEAVEQESADDENWITKLELHPKTGEIKSTIDNVCIILKYDPDVKGRFAMNEFAGRLEVLGALPWDKRTGRRLWDDTDVNGLYWYLEKAYGITGKGNIDSAVSVHAAQHKFNDVQNYLQNLEWDGVPRLDTMFIDYLGAEDTPYTRAVCRKAFTAAVARAMTPGCKYDNMLILCGPQGLGKSTLLDKMSKGWFNDSIRTFEGKEASELLQGVWLVEVAELDALKKSDASRVKQFLSLRADRYRAAYGRNVKELPRCCVFFGTCNQISFLQDTTGNRRFWPVDVAQGKKRAKDLHAAKSVFKDLDGEVDQIWAEAKVRWQMGEPLYLTGEIEEAAFAKQEEHREASVREGLILEFVERPVPSDWVKWSIDRRRDFWAQATHGDIELVPRDRVTAAEVWCELFNGNFKDLDNRNTREINAVLEALPGWDRAKKTMRFGPYSVQRGFVRTCNDHVTINEKPL